MENAQRIRRLSMEGLDATAIGRRLKIRPAIVRRVLARSDQRGAPRKRPASAKLSFVTRPEIASRLRAIAASQGVPLSDVIEHLVELGLERSGKEPSSSARPPRSSRRDALAGLPQRKEPSLRSRRNKAARNVAPSTESGPAQSIPEALPVTAADMPESVTKLLKSYALEELRWAEPNDRHEIVVTILTRGDGAAKRRLWTVLPRSEARELVRQYHGAGCSEPERALLRKHLRLTTTDLPERPYLGLGTEP